LRRLVDSFEYLGAPTIGFNVEGMLDPVVEQSIAEPVYRIVQESISNAAKHSGATAVSLDAQFTQDQVTVVIADNGTGFQRGGAGDGRGLKIMQYRARAIGGQLEVQSSPSGGVTVRLMCPLSASRSATVRSRI
jgi:signal transduction histidine kinase